MMCLVDFFYSDSADQQEVGKNWLFVVKGEIKVMIVPVTI